LFQLAGEQTIRHHDEIHVPGLALSVTQLTIAHAEFLFSVPVKGLRARPAITVHPQDSLHFPVGSIRDQDFACFFVAALVIVFADVSRLRVRAEIDERHAHGLREGQAAVVFGRNLGGQRFPGRVSCVKRLMGGKTVFARTASERKDLDAVQVFIDFDAPFVAPVGLRVDVAIEAGGRR
jgi:hypothetical protein